MSNEKNDTTTKVLQVIGVLVVLVATVTGVMASFSSKHVTKAVFQEFKEGTVANIYRNLESLNDKMDIVIKRLEDLERVEPKR